MRSTVYSHVKVAPSIPLAAITSNTTTNGTAVDLDQSGQDFRVATMVVATGTLTDGNYAFKVQESSTGTGGWTDVPADRLQGSVPTAAATDDNKVYEVGVVPNERYIRAVCTSTTVTTGGTLTAMFLLGGGNGTVRRS